MLPPQKMGFLSREAVEELASRLQECLNRLRQNADNLAGNLFHHNLLFGDPEFGRLDQEFEELIAELKALTVPNAGE